MRYCCFCGDALGILTRAQWEPTDTCGKHECEQEARYAAEAERAEAHARLDEDMGY